MDGKLVSRHSVTPGNVHAQLNGHLEVNGTSLLVDHQPRGLISPGPRYDQLRWKLRHTCQKLQFPRVLGNRSRRVTVKIAQSKLNPPAHDAGKVRWKSGDVTLKVPHQPTNSLLGHLVHFSCRTTVYRAPCEETMTSQAATPLVLFYSVLQNQKGHFIGLMGPSLVEPVCYYSKVGLRLLSQI